MAVQSHMRSRYKSCMSDSTADLEQELLAVAKTAALAGGAELTARWRAPISFHTKSTPTDPVSAADLASEQKIRSILAQERPDDAILGEEGGHTDGAGSGSGLRWIIDPLDGTVNYLYGLPMFAVSVAVEDDQGLLAALVLEPTTGEMFSATRSTQTQFLPANGGEPQPLNGSGCQELSLALVATGFSYNPQMRAVQARTAGGVIPRARDIRRIGAAALDLCWVAAGRLDCFYEGRINLWDIAAGNLICERAGIVVRKLPEVYDAEGELLSNGGVIAAPPALVDELYALATARPGV